MSRLNAKIVGSINIGGALNVHADYKVEIIWNGSAWCIYRRYSTFEGLHASLVSNYGADKVKALNLNFPDKSYSGSTMGSLQYFVEKRIVLLQQYLDTLLAIDGTIEISAVKVFFDLNNKGLSGLQVQLGGNKILKETFARTKLIKNLLGTYGTSFVALLKSGSVVVMQSMYDNLSNAEININITGGSAIVIPKAKDNVVHITERATGNRLFISFSTPAEAAYWIRAISDFSVSTSVGTDARVEAESRRKQQEAERRNPRSNTAPTEHLKAAGTGNTVDELSAAFGI